MIDVKFYSVFAYILYAITIILLMAVLVVGIKVHGARSWFSLGGFNFQPSEFAKVATEAEIQRMAEDNQYSAVLHIVDEQ